MCLEFKFEVLLICCDLNFCDLALEHNDSVVWAQQSQSQPGPQ